MLLNTRAAESTRISQKKKQAHGDCRLCMFFFYSERKNFINHKSRITYKHIKKTSRLISFEKQSKQSDSKPTLIQTLAVQMRCQDQSGVSIAFAALSSNCTGNYIAKHNSYFSRFLNCRISSCMLTAEVTCIAGSLDCNLRFVIC